MGLIDIAWPGPRPLSNLAEDDGALVAERRQFLAGRQGELQELFDACRTYDVILITAWSGVGKTSFVKAGLVPLLRDTRRFVPVIKKWPDAIAELGLSRDDLTPEAAANRLYRATIGAAAGDDRLTPLAALQAVDDGRRCTVVVLDQFEELLRYLPAVAQHLLRVVGATARDTGLPHIVLARSEYAERLRPVEVSRSTRWTLRLSDITDEDVLASIIVEPAQLANVSFAPEAVALLVGWWTASKATVESRRAQRVGAEGLTDIGLLHFQALLWSFRKWGLARGLDDRVTALHARMFAAQQLGKSRPDVDVADGLLLVEGALAAYVREQVEHLATGVTPVAWKNGPAVMLARTTPGLMAAGYKQAQSLLSLIPYALSDELGPRVAHVLSRVLVDQVTRDSGQAARGEALGEFFGAASGLGAGIAEGWPDSEIVREMIDCLAFALKRMSAQDVNILREMERPGQPIYELVHDGMGPALNEWARAFVGSDVAQVGVIAAQTGSSLGTSLRGRDFGRMTATARRVWGIDDVDARRGAVVFRMRRPASYWGPAGMSGVEIRDIEFRECDFTGSKFHNVTFKNVEFNRCALSSTLLEDCSLEDVVFRSDPACSRPGSLGLLTVRFKDRGSRDARVRFIDIPETVGIFLEGLDGGRWTFENARVLDLVVTSHQDVVLKFRRGCSIAPLSTHGTHPATWTKDAASKVRRLDPPPASDAEP